LGLAARKLFHSSFLLHTHAETHTWQLLPMRKRKGMVDVCVFMGEDEPYLDIRGDLDKHIGL